MNEIVGIKRDNERMSQSKPPHRGDRFFKLSNNWYFTTREGFSMGPYDSHELAQKGTGDYIAFVHNAAPHVLKLLVPNVQAARA
jgi:uncharacterized protein DUF6316